MRPSRRGRSGPHRCADIGLADTGTANSHSDFVFPSYQQVAQVADAVGVAVWLMRGCGLRIEEALAVEKSDFRMAGVRCGYQVRPPATAPRGCR